MGVGASLDHAYAATCGELERSAAELLARGLSPAEARAAAAALTAGASDPLGDGDQTPVTQLHGMEGVKECEALRAAWASGLDVNDCVTAPTPANRFHAACFFGEASRVRKLVDGTRAAAAGLVELEQQLLRDLTERRVSKLRLSALAYCCLGARNLDADNMPPNPEWFRWKECAEILIKAGANVNARDLGGYSVISICGAYGAAARSIEIIPLLVAEGADPNVKTRFDEVGVIAFTLAQSTRTAPVASVFAFVFAVRIVVANNFFSSHRMPQPIIFGAITSNNIKGMKALLLAGADLDLGDRDGLTARRMLSSIPTLLKAVTEADHDLAVAASKCSACRAMGARSRCLRCRSVFYCNVECQRAHWKLHRKTCGKFSTDYVDVDTACMIASKHDVGLVGNVEFVSILTGKKGGPLAPPKKKKLDEVFVVKTQRMFLERLQQAKAEESRGGAAGSGVNTAASAPIRISNKANDYMLLSGEGTGSAVHTKLLQLIDSGGPAGSISKGQKLYFSAKWVDKDGGGRPTVLRINTKNNLPAPKPLW